MNNKLQQAFIDDPETLRILEQRQQTKLLKDIANKKPSMEDTFSQILSLLKGEPGVDGRDGIDGYTPVKGVDYFDGVDGKNGVDGQNGRNGKDGITPSKTELLNIITPLIPKALEGIKGQDGKDTSPLEVITTIKNLKGKDAEDFAKSIGSMIDISQIRNAQSFMFNGKRIKFEELMHGGGSSSSISSGYQVPTGVVNGINTVFTFTTAPSAIVVDGVSMRKVATDGTINWTGTNVITLAVAPNFDIYAVA